MYVKHHIWLYLEQNEKGVLERKEEKIQRHDFLHHQSIYLYTKVQSYKVCVEQQHECGRKFIFEICQLILNDEKAKAKMNDFGLPFAYVGTRIVYR